MGSDFQNLRYLDVSHHLTSAQIDFTPGKMKKFDDAIRLVKTNWSLLATYYANFPTPPKAHPLSDLNGDIVYKLILLLFAPCTPTVKTIL